MSDNETNERDEIILTNRLGKEATYKFFNTLIGLVKALEGQYTVVDLRNESCVTGKIVFVDGMMNVEMEDVIYYDPRGVKHIFPSFFINKRNIRYVHIPKKLSATQLIEKQMQDMSRKKKKKDHTFKKVRAARYNKEIVQSAFSEKTTE